MHKLSVMLAATTAIAIFTSPASAQVLGSGNPPDSTFVAQRDQEVGGASGPGIFNIAVPPAATLFVPVTRVPRNQFGVVGPGDPLISDDLKAMVFPDATTGERLALIEGLDFFTREHTTAEGLGPMNNQVYCLGCHQNAKDAIVSAGLLNPKECDFQGDAPCTSVVTRAGRSTPTNFKFTSLDPITGGGVAPGSTAGSPPDPGAFDAVNSTGVTAAFTTFGDFAPTKLTDRAPGAIGFFDPLDGASHNLLGGGSFQSQQFGGFVQHVRPGVPDTAGENDCIPKPIPPVAVDNNFANGNPNGFRRSIGERAGPPYIGRGLIEAVPTADITGNTDPKIENGTSSLPTPDLGCAGAGCISGKANMIPRTVAEIKDAMGNLIAVRGFDGGVGRFGLRANGVELLQFVIGGAQGELAFTSNINPAEGILPPFLFPAGKPPTPEPAACLADVDGAGTVASPKSPEVFLSTMFSTRSLLRNTAPPEFGDTLLDLLRSRDPSKPLPGNNPAARVQRGAQLFGIDLVAFANRTVGNPMTATGDGLDINAINQKDRQLNCVGCHIPIQRTGQSPAGAKVASDVGAEHLSFVWAPIFSDLLIHKGPSVDAERISQRPRDPLVISRQAGPGNGKATVFNTFDLPRNLADDTFNGQKAQADGREFRTAPLMGLARVGTPFLHDGRVYLAAATVDTTPAGTVTTNTQATNAPLVVRTVDDALLAAIELHDLPAPDDNNTPTTTQGAGCPVPPGATNVDYGSSPKDVICPAINSDHRSDAREVIYRFRKLSPDDQQAVIEFLKQL